jgi:hypothetical protein
MIGVGCCCIISSEASQLRTFEGFFDTATKAAVDEMDTPLLGYCEKIGLISMTLAG